MRYNNLTQNTDGRLVYFRSTDVEQHNWHRLLWSVPDEMLYLLSLGEVIEIHDKTGNMRGGKIKRIFCPVLTDVLNYLFFDQVAVNKKLIDHFRLALAAIKKDKSLQTKFLFWKHRIKDRVKIIGVDEYVAKEPNPI